MTHDEMKKEAWICVLNDDATYTGLTGCWIALTPQDVVESLDDGADVEIVPGLRYDLQKLLEWAIDAGAFDLTGDA